MKNKNFFYIIKILYISIFLFSNLSHAEKIPGKNRLGDRWQIYNLLSKLLANNQPSKEFDTLLMKHILENSNFFGGQCNPYEFKFNDYDHNPHLITPTSIRYFIFTNPAELTESEFQNRKSICWDSTELKVPFTGNGIARIASVIKFCYEAFTLDSVIDYLKSIACTDTSCSKMTPAHVENLYYHFYPFQKNDNALDAETSELILEDICDNTNRCNIDTAVKSLGLALCQDPNWQNF